MSYYRRYYEHEAVIYTGVQTAHGPRSLKTVLTYCNTLIISLQYLKIYTSH